MIDKIRIKNFKSLKEVELELQKVNLLIGPNNSGKTNFLKAVEYFFCILKGEYEDSDSFNQNIFRNKKSYLDDSIVASIIINKETNYQYLHLYYEILYLDQRYDIPIYHLTVGLTNKDEFLLKDIKNYKNDTDLFDSLLINKHTGKNNQWKWNEESTIDENQIRDSQAISDKAISNVSVDDKLERNKNLLTRDKDYKEIVDIFRNIRIYKPDPNAFSSAVPVYSEDRIINFNASNLVSFLDNIRDEKPELIEKIEEDIKRYIPEFNGIRFAKVKVENDQRTHKKIGLINKHNIIFWADELSEGALYFLSILAIVHQPDPPKVLMLEEPERYIHPRRIQEVMDLLFQLAEDKNIQIIMTTHSPLVVDEFKDIPESVFVFEMEDGETKVKNLKTIITSNNEMAKANNLPESDYLSDLGENWILGFLGGVPDAAN